MKVSRFNTSEIQFDPEFENHCDPKSLYAKFKEYEYGNDERLIARLLDWIDSTFSLANETVTITSFQIASVDEQSPNYISASLQLRKSQHNSDLDEVTPSSDENDELLHYQLNIYRDTMRGYLCQTPLNHRRTSLAVTKTRQRTTSITSAASTSNILLNPFSAVRILIVDDSSMDRKLLKRLCLHLGISEDNITEAENGSIAVEQCQSSFFDLILMDYHMPVINGLNAISAITTQANTNIFTKHNAKTRIVMVSASNDITDTQVISNGGDLFLCKPLRKDTLRKQLNLVLKTLPKKRRMHRKKQEIRELAQSLQHLFSQPQNDKNKENQGKNIPLNKMTSPKSCLNLCEATFRPKLKKASSFRQY